MNVGVVGCGDISPLYLRSAKHFPILNLVACADLNRDAARARAAEFGVEALSVPELLNRPDIDIILNITVPSAHAAVAKAALTAGKHVYNEKPLATDLDDAKELLGLADSKGLRVACAPSSFLGAAVQTCRKLVDEGAIGTPVAFHTSLLGHGMEGWHPNPEFFYRPGGGPLLDVGPYIVAALTALLGPVARVASMGRVSFPERTITAGPRAGTVFPVGTPTHIVSTLEFVGGAIGTLTTSFDVWASEQPKFELYGSTGTLRLAAPNLFGGPVWIHEAGGAWEEKPLVHPYNSLESGWSIALADLALAIQEERPHRADGRFALHALEVMQACLQSAETGEAVAVESRPKRPEPLWPGVDGGLL